MAQLALAHPAPLSGAAPPRADHGAIALMVREGARVLDVGCGDGALMSLLARETGAKARGLELNPTRVQACVARGLSVVQGDAEQNLAAFPACAFDYVIFSHALLALKHPRAALRQAARVGERVIVSIANAGHWRARVRLLTSGRALGTPLQGEYSCSVRDFAILATETRLEIERATPLSRGHPGAPFAKTLWRANWFAEEAVFLLVS